jgi:hypothetical protein
MPLRDMLSLTVQDHCFWQSLWGLLAAQVRRSQQRIITPEVEQVLAMHLNALQRLATDGGSACGCTQLRVFRQTTAGSWCACPMQAGWHSTQLAAYHL